jgi:MFS family permease
MFKSLSRDQKTILIVLSFINFFNYIDRQVVFALLDLIKKEFMTTDFQLGMLGTMFMLVHSLSSLPLGMLADRYDRRKVISLGVLFWSVTSFFSGLVHSFKALLVARSLVGIGESSYAPAATAMISDNLPEETRAQAQGVFNIGMFVGGTLGVMLGGIIAYYTHSWRLAFFLVSIPGLFLAFFTLNLKDNKTEHHQEKMDFIGLMKNYPYRWIIISGVLVTFAASAFVSWGVEFIMRYKGYNLRDTSLILGVIMMVAGVTGVVVGSWVADKLQKKIVWGRSITVGVSLLLAAPAMYIGLADIGSKAVFLVFFFLGTVLLSVYHGPAVAVLHDVTNKEMRATAFAFYVLCIHLVGSTTAPAAVGAISDRYGLRVGLELCTILVFLSGLAFMVVSYYLQKHHEVLLGYEEPVSIE